MSSIISSIVIKILTKLISFLVDLGLDAIKMKKADKEITTAIEENNIEKVNDLFKKL